MAWPARLDLRFDRRGDRTVVFGRHDGPLRVLRSLHPEPAVCQSVIVHPPGGIVGGDTLSIAVDVATGAHAQLTMPGALAGTAAPASPLGSRWRCTSPTAPASNGCHSNRSPTTLAWRAVRRASNSTTAAKGPTAFSTPVDRPRRSWSRTPATGRSRSGRTTTSPRPTRRCASTTPRRAACGSTSRRAPRCASSGGSIGP